MKKTIVAVLVGISGLTCLASNANAHDSVGFSISLGAPYYAPPPVYVAPAPVYYGPPVVYYRPAPVYYGPSAYYRFEDSDHHDRGWHRGWGHHARYHDRDDD